jgi:hypothetical protein
VSHLSRLGAVLGVLTANFIRAIYRWKASQIVSQYALTVSDDLLNKRIGILEILSGKAVGLDTQIHFAGEAHELNIFVEAVDFVPV